MRAAGLKVWARVPQCLQLLCFPTVVAFSLTTKRWGHVLVDCLQPIAPDRCHARTLPLILILALTRSLTRVQTESLTLALYCILGKSPVHRFALVSRPINTHVMLKLLLSTNHIFRQESPYALLL